MKRLELRSSIVGIALVWIFVVVASYYVSHKPFSMVNVLAVSQAAAGLVGATLVLGIGIGIGERLLRSLKMGVMGRLILSAGLGMGALSLVGLALGSLGLLRPWILWLLTGVGLLLTGRSVLRLVRQAWSDAAWRPRGGFERFLALYCGLMLWYALIQALAPPTAWDSLVYHLTGPRLYLSSGSVSHPLDLPYLGFPQLIGMLFTWGVGLVGERAAAPIHWFYGVLAVLLLVVIGRRWLSGACGWLAAAVLLSAPSIVRLAGQPYVDLALLFYTTAAFWALGHFLSDVAQAWRWLFLCGAFAGFAVGTKYTALALVPALMLALLLFLRFHGRRLLLGVRGAFLMGVTALGIWCPWLIKNWILTRNPLYPFFFDGVYWDPYRAWWYDRPGTGLAYTQPWRLLVAPWDATMWSVEGARLEGFPGYAATIGPLFLAFLPLLPLMWRRLSLMVRRRLWMALFLCGVLYGFWLWGVGRSDLLVQTRLLFPAFGLLALLTGSVIDGLHALPRRPVDVGWVSRAVVVGVLVLMLGRVSLAAINDRPLDVLLGFEGREAYLKRRLGWYYVAVDYVNRQLPPDVNVLFLWEPRSYHCTQATSVCVPDALLDRWLHATHYLYGQAPGEIARAWQADGVTHVLFSQTGYDAVRSAGFDPLTEADVKMLRVLKQAYLEEIQRFGDAYVLYQLRAP